jgi:hypothetical protein
VYGNPIADMSGTTVVLDNGAEVYRVTTDTAGWWTVPNAPAGVYTVKASRDGFVSIHDGTPSDSIKNMQYVGAGTFTTFDLNLMQEVLPTTVSDVSAVADWKIVKDSNSHGVSYDTTITLSIRAKTKNTGTYIYRFSVTDQPGSDCATAIETREMSLRSALGEVSTVIQWTTFMSNEIKAKLGTDFKGKTFYAQVRPRVLRRDVATGKFGYVCVEPAMVPFTF